MSLQAKLAYGLFLIGLGLVIALSATNSSAVTINLFGLQSTLPSGMLLGVAYFAGVILTAPILGLRMTKDTASVQKIEEWKAQDAKLLKEVQTDREKQLEAKVATLEAALQRALKK